MKPLQITLLTAVVIQGYLPTALFAQVKSAEEVNRDILDLQELSNPRSHRYSLIDDTGNSDRLITIDGFLPLFDGTTLNGWVQRGGKAKYAVEDGMIVGTTVPHTPNSFLCTDKDYADFILELDFKIDDGANSGVQFRSECFDKPTTLKTGGKEIKIPAGRVHGYQYEIDMDPKRARWWTAGVYDEARRGWLYPGALGGDGKTFTAQGAKICKQNEWNHLRIEAVGDSIKTWLNGVPAADLQDSLTKKGFIALQVHGVGEKQEPLHVYFKNIRLKDLSQKQ
jgi:hypothetical protein